MEGEKDVGEIKKKGGGGGTRGREALRKNDTKVKKFTEEYEVKIAGKGRKRSGGGRGSTSCPSVVEYW